MPDLPDGPLKELKAAIHELHDRAGNPSARDLASRLNAEGITASHTRVHDVFASERLPDRDLLLALAGILGDRAHGLGRQREVDRFIYLWADARYLRRRPQQSRGSLSVPPSERPEYWVPAPERETLARMVLAAATEDELDYIVMILNAGGDPRSLGNAITPIATRLPHRDQRILKDLAGTTTLVPYLRSELDGSAAQAKRKIELVVRLDADAHDQMDTTNHQREKRAIEIRCAGNGRSCGKVRAIAYTVPRRGKGDPILILHTVGGSAQVPVYTQGVLPDFSNDLEVYSYECRHNGTYMDDGVFPTMPASLLDDPFYEFQRRGRVQTIRWAPKEHIGRLNRGQEVN